MITDIQGLHHVTSIASDAQHNNDFFTKVLGLRRVKKTVNFDAPEVYHLHYGDEVGTPGSVMTYFPFPHARRGSPGAGEVGTTAFSVPQGALPYWSTRLSEAGVSGLSEDSRFGEPRLAFHGPDGDGFALVEVAEDPRAPWTGGGVPEEAAIRGFHSTDMALRDIGATAELLRFMGYEESDRRADVTRFHLPGRSAAHVIDLTEVSAPAAGQGAGSVHHVAFAVENRARQLDVRKALMDTGFQVTPVIDRDYFWAIYFQTPGGVLFEVATNEPGFDRDEDIAHLGEALKLPTQHEHLREALESRYLAPIRD
ncbi:Putative ring-cleaving dioxygenase MhqO [Roseivivax jejudonensis]|uniref:Putative ring-cleaving dioxygenase MhqO n=1 Tax=Roseivivax jejudonensis TaxID=1529041 RepID=A0A1X6ZSP7_9RHOB|nr:VOC family protein [Roseivivax jejudonensis]SLN59957.1 Putative ring-cleaving dioxygenase MhqO [Roseivivax jejudonensis]